MSFTGCFDYENAPEVFRPVELSSSSSSSYFWRVSRVSCSLTLRWSWSLHLFLGLLCSVVLLVYILVLVLVVCLCPSSVHAVATFYGTVLFPLLCSVLPFFCLLLWFFSLSSFVIPRKCLKNFICVPSKRCSSLFVSTQASLPNFNAALAVMLWILNFVHLFSKISSYSSVYFVICLQFIS